MERPRKFDPPWIDFFTRPCPWFEKQLTCFPQFPQLPRELQLMIWERAEPSRQVVSLSSHFAPPEDAEPDAPPEIGLQYRRPGMLQACYDARVAGLKSFTPAFKSYLPSPVRFNFNLDFLELDMHMVEWIATVHESEMFAPVDPPKVKYLAISHYRQFRGEDFVLICQYFSGLKILMVNEPEADESNPTNGFVHLFDAKDANFISRHRWCELRKPIMKIIRGVRPRLQEWEPPALFVGTETQWSQHALLPVVYKCRTSPDHMSPVRSTPKSDFMDWQPTINIPSLEFVPRLETVGAQYPSLSVQLHTSISENRAKAEYYKAAIELLKMLAWVFEDTSLRFHVMGASSGQDVENWIWPGR